MAEIKLSIAVDIVLFTIQHDELKVLLIKRASEPFRDMWAIPGGRVMLDESLESAARRELKEETGLETAYLEQLYTFGNPGRDPRGRVISVTYYALVDSSKLHLKPDTDAKDAEWFATDNLPTLAFDHKEILDYALKRLRYKLTYTTVGFQLLPEKFTLTELQKIYEVILGRSLDKRNFRKKIASLDIVRATKETKMEGPHRPALLYIFRKEYKIFGRDIV